MPYIFKCSSHPTAIQEVLGSHSSKGTTLTSPGTADNPVAPWVLLSSFTGTVTHHGPWCKALTGKSHPKKTKLVLLPYTALGRGSGLSSVVLPCPRKRFNTSFSTACLKTTDIPQIRKKQAKGRQHWTLISVFFSCFTVMPIHTKPTEGPEDWIQNNII